MSNFNEFSGVYSLLLTPFKWDRSVDYKAVGLVKIRKEEFPKNTSRKIKRFEIDKSID